MADVHFIPNHNKSNCWGCSGKGYVIKNGYARECKCCGGTGYFVDKTYTLIYTDNKGIKHGFIVDGIK
jgi:DnaJ-class molecular chaperone